MKVSAFVRSYAKDFPWLDYALRSLRLRGGQFHEIVLAIPFLDAKHLGSVNLVGVKVVEIKPTCAPPYVDQQASKIWADKYCSGDYIFHLDSDCMATEEINLADFFFEGKPKQLFRKWENAGGAIIWRPVTKAVLKQDPPYECMPAMPFLYHRSTHELFRNQMERNHGYKFRDWIGSIEQLSEFNAIGNYCHLYTPEEYHFIEATGPGDGYPRPIRQFWSHAPINHAEMEPILL